MDPEDKSENFFFPTKHVIPESLKFSHWLSEYIYIYKYISQMVVFHGDESHGTNGAKQK